MRYDTRMPAHEKDVVISITAGTIIKTVAILLCVLLLWVLRDLVLVIATSVVIASSIEPAVKFFARYRIPRIPTVLFVFIAIAGSFVGLFFSFVPPVIKEFADFSEKIPAIAQGLNLNITKVDVGTIKKGEYLVNQVTQGASPQEILTALSNTLSTSKGFAPIIGTISGGLFSFILIVVLSFYFAMQEHGIENFLKAVTPFNKEEYAINLWMRSRTKIGKWMQGQLLLGVLIFVLVYLGLTIFGVPYALMLALFAGLLEIIPVFGPIISAIPGVALAFGSGGTSLALIITCFYLLVQQFENHLIYPLVVRKIVGVPPILAILALAIGLELAGFLGVIISIPIATVIMEVIEDIEKKKKRIA